MNVTVFTDHAKGTISIKADGAEAATLNINALGWGEAEAFTVLIAATLRGESTNGDEPTPARRPRVATTDEATA